MPKTDGDITRQKILEVAEQLFSEKGYDGTSIDAVSKAAGINKATIYYHFKDKQDIIMSLFNRILVDLESQLKANAPVYLDMKDALRQEIRFLEKKKKILSVMLMEALKEKNTDNSFFRCMHKAIENEMEENQKSYKIGFGKIDKSIYLHEFFTGVIPIITFVVLKDKWCEFYDYSPGKALENFLESFENTHLNSHP